MNREALLSIYHFNADANRAAINVAEQLSEEAFTREFSPSHGSVQRLLVHILGGEVYFIAACTGETPDMDAIEALHTQSSISARFDQAARDSLAYLEGASDDDLQQNVSLSFGEFAFTLPRWQVLMQQFSHAHMHRGELSILLSQLGHPLPTLDLMVHWIKASGQEWPFG